MTRYALLAFSSLVILTACTQPAAVVDNRGQESFNRNGATGGAPLFAYHSPSSTYASNTPYQHPPQTYSNATSSNAPVSGIGVTDLSPAAGPNASSIPPAQTMGSTAPAMGTTQAFGTTKPSAPLDASNVRAENAPVNLWTNKPREGGSLSQPSATSKDVAYIWPVSSHDVISSFGSKGAGKANDGMNISAAQGEPVWAAADGEVVYADDKMKGYGNMVLIKHAGGKTSTYAHMARTSVEKYDRVKQGDIIGYVGSTGNVKKPQLYFSMRNGTQAVDPQKYLDRNVAGL